MTQGVGSKVGAWEGAKEKVNDIRDSSSVLLWVHATGPRR